MPRIALLGSGLVGMFYTMALHAHRGRDRVQCIYSRSAARAAQFAREWNIPRHTDRMEDAIRDPEIDAVIVALPNHLHEPAVLAAAAAGKAVLCTKPLGRNAAEAHRMLEAVERAGVFHAYLEDLVYTPKTLKALAAVASGAIGRVQWVRSREAHSGPHSAWFWDPQLAGGGAIIDLGCHCIEIARNFIGREVRPLEVMCWADTQTHAIEAEDHAIGLVRYENGAIGQFEVSWAFRGGMDLRDEVAGTAGTIWLNHWLRTGIELFTASQPGEYVAEKAEAAAGWQFPVGDEPKELGYVDMFSDAFDALEQGRAPRETFYDGWVVNSVIDAAYRSAVSKRWEPIALEAWRGTPNPRPLVVAPDDDPQHTLIKQERLADGRIKRIVRHKTSGEILERIEPPTGKTR